MPNTNRESVLLGIIGLDAQAALDETCNALQALEKGDKRAALAYLERGNWTYSFPATRDWLWRARPIRDMRSSIIFRKSRNWAAWPRDVQPAPAIAEEV